MSKTALYRHYDENDNLLYIGISCNHNKRLSTHIRKSKWNHLSVKVLIEWHESREQALNAESRAIQMEMPLYNVHHNKNNTKYCKSEIKRREDKRILLKKELELIQNRIVSEKKDLDSINEIKNKLKNDVEWYFSEIETHEKYLAYLKGKIKNMKSNTNGIVEIAGKLMYLA